jgi:microcystin-dependent protein
MAFKNYDSSGNVLSRSLTDLPVGTVVSTALSAAPSGWLICDGTAVSRTNYPELFGALGTGYGAGDGTTTFNVPNSDGQMILAISTAQRIGVAMPPQFVTTLPASPIDGTEVYYQADSTNGVIWHLRYRAASASAYKWEFVGGAPMTAVGAGEAGFTSSSFRTNGQASLTLPAVAGDYFITLQAFLLSNSTVANNVYCVLFDDATETSVSLIHVASGIYDAGFQARTVRLDAVSASSVLTTKHKTLNSVASNISAIQIAVTPIRVSA